VAAVGDFLNGGITVNRIKQIAALCLLALPVAAFAGGSATGIVTKILVDASFANVAYVTLSGVKTGNPACSSSTRGQFVIPVTVANDYANMLTLVLQARDSGTSITITGQNQCNVDNNVETIQNVTI
jgi:hypothetical protein